MLIKDVHYLFIHKAKKILTDPLVCDSSVLEKPSLISNPHTSITFHCHSSLTAVFINFISLHPVPSLIPCNEVITQSSAQTVLEISSALLIIRTHSPSPHGSTVRDAHKHLMLPTLPPPSAWITHTPSPASGPRALTPSFSPHPCRHHPRF